METSDYTVTSQQEIESYFMQRPHVVILGAGASVASIPNGDANGQKIPVMKNLIEILNLEYLIKDLPDNIKKDDFEQIYSYLVNINYPKEKIQEIEEKIYNHFKQYRLPDFPTVYDYLLLSLRQKDIVATFNWDSLLVQAYIRNQNIAPLPRLIYLHGNVSIGLCKEDNTLGVNGCKCSKCGNDFVPTKLIFPIQNKDYDEDYFIKRSWEEVRLGFKNAFMVTIFGYSAPKADHAAISLLKDAWGDAHERNLEQFEIIDTKEEDEIKGSWDNFIHSHHYDFHHDFCTSWIANHPRRTGEAYWHQYMDAKFIENNPIPKEANFKELKEWIEPLLKRKNITK